MLNEPVSLSPGQARLVHKTLAEAYADVSCLIALSAALCDEGSQLESIGETCLILVLRRLLRSIDDAGETLLAASGVDLGGSENVAAPYWARLLL